MTSDAPEHVWYAGYGSNLHPDRFRCYLQGGAVQGMVRAAAGSRDRSAWSAQTTGTLPGALRFAGTFTTWGTGTSEGGAAFLELQDDAERPPQVPDEAGPFAVHAVAYRISPLQLVDVLLQESGRDPTSASGTDVHAAVEQEVLRFLLDEGGSRARTAIDELVPELLSDAAYGRLVRLPLLLADGGHLSVHVVAGTSRLPDRDPVPAYLDVMHRGLVETVGLAPSVADAYLAARLSARSSGGTGSEHEGTALPER